MSEVLTSNITVDFSSKAAEASLKIETDDRNPSLRTQYLRVFPARTGVIFATTGTLTRSGNDVKDIEEVVAFNNNKEASLSYPNARRVSIDLLGSFYGTDGYPTSTHLAYDSVTNSITSTTAGFGVATLTYESDYTLYKFLYDGVGCPYEEDYSGAPNAPAAESPYEDSLIVVYVAAEGDFASINLEGPECNFKEGGGESIDSQASKLILEVDKEGPAAIKIYPRQNGAISYSGDIAASATIRLYPDVPAIFDTTEGTLSPISSGHQADQVDMLNFAYSNGTSLKYPQASGVSFEQLTDFTDEWDRPLSNHAIRFMIEGAEVLDVKWNGPDSYTGYPSPRIVKSGEVVIVDSSSYVVKVSGVARATYVSTYRKFAYDFTLVRGSDAKVTDILDTDITARYQKQSVSLKLKGPTISGTDIYTSPDIT